jgi:tetraacyldisaccharide 4'-kinase
MPDWARIHEDKKFRAGYLPLAFLSSLYGTAVRLRLKLFNKENARSLPGFTISIGNLTAGGTGKTPATLMLAEWAAAEGLNAAVLSRGYGGANKKATIVSDGVRILADPETVGDEACLLAQRLKGVPVVVSKNRYHGGLLAHNRFNSSFFILDDGYQHLALKRDLNLLLLDSLSPFGNGRLLPWGPLREPVSEIRRADAVILTRALELNDKGMAEFKKALVGVQLFRADHVPEGVIFPSGDQSYPPAFLKGRRVAAFAGIGRPESFRETLMGLGAEVSFFKPFPDHHPFTGDEIRSLIKEKNNAGADLIITTEKDWMRAASLFPEDQSAAYLTIRFDLMDDKERFFTMVREKFNNKKADECRPGYKHLKENHHALE